MAAEVECGGLILVSPYTSVKASLVPLCFHIAYHIRAHRYLLMGWAGHGSETCGGSDIVADC